MTFLLTSLFLIALMGFAFHQKHLLSALLCLESMMLTIFITLSLWPNQMTSMPLSLPLVLLSMSACEAGLGLSLMVATARSHGNDNLTTLNLLRC
uniref:NADH dehydrogenase subunit 4L n=1 Tax=Gracixalus yunnanensis TaxID=2596631 RepID=UPI001F13AEBF|nr:NADH dehydrogenase subunit 4L [Gracixalus yunnanensis]UMI33291.1 NADH dehydrogenase subunit 4L [Gracixalus yunnanensis]